MITRYTACAACGAIVAVEVINEDVEVTTVIDNKATHAAWHERLGRLLLKAGLFPSPASEQG